MGLITLGKIVYLEVENSGTIGSGDVDAAAAAAWSIFSSFNHYLDIALNPCLQ